MSTRPDPLGAAANATRSRRKSSQPNDTKAVQINAHMQAHQRDALRVAGARQGLSLSTTVAALAMAAVEDDERLTALLEDYAADAHRPRGQASHQQE